MNVKLCMITTAALFFTGQVVHAQKVLKDTATKEQKIEEVVMVGYGTQKKSEVTASVSQVKASEIAGLVTPSFESQLAGRAAGVNVTTNTGIVGAAPNISIRGVNSINSGTYPLIILDGMPIFTGDTGGYAPNNALADINPSDIESIEILKDGAAAAIYGSRAANGVMIITTKKGKKGRFQLDYNTYTGFADAAKRFNLLQTPDFLAISNEKRSNRGLAPWAVGNTLNTDWQKAVLRTATQTDHNISLQGGMAKGSYFASVGYTKQDGIILSNGMERFSARFNVNQEVNNWLKVGVNLGVTRTAYEGLNNTTNGLSGAISNAVKQLPNTAIYDSNGPFGYNIDVVGSNTIVGKGQNTEYIANNLPNILYVLKTNRFESKVLRVLGDIYADAKILPYLNYRLQISADRSQNEGLLYYNAFHGDGVGSKGRIQNNNSTFERYNFQNVLTFDKTFGQHKVGVTLVNEYQKEVLSSFFGGGTDLANSFFNSNVISGSYGTPISGGGKTDFALISYAARFNYDFGKRYFFQGIIRRDDLSSLPVGGRVGYFPGASLGWNVSNENFFKGAKDVINDLKLRASYGRVGNSNIGNYPYLSLYGTSKYGDLNGIGYSQMGNDNLRWERSEKFDYGVDFGLFKNKVRINVDYFINNIDEMIQKVSVDPSLGIPDNEYSANIGAAKNKGWEFSVNYSPIKNDNFEININANLSLINNRITRLNDGKDIFPTNPDWNNIDLNYRIHKEGYTMNQLYGVKYWGVNPTNGNPVYHRLDGSLVQLNIPNNSYFVFDPNNPSKMDEVGAAPQNQLLGNTIPKYFGAFNLSMRYRDFDFGTLVRFSGGNYIMNITRREMLSQFFVNNSTEILGRWQSPDNPGDGWTPRLWSSNDPGVNGPSVSNSRFIEKGDFIKFDNITLGYSLNKDFLNKLNIQKLRLYIQAQNAVIITKYSGADPEMQINGIDYNGVPRQRVFSVGLNVTL
ncbi:SusC/RagA family TonB-linked outer membrane protein [Chryseobacterium paridis]|uniref:SusC/RagA family TonB-linked outer membrane protein n=1 Tax=Chryseobacterium paridis TaxID=2800328 RepID=A0ABS1FYN0_9FLAO|nr:SusC/RagA family TonB-linked outer membrane protein [Chryseobacterium paridis]MBK1897557.1 SusC/RagA family TonB-linked outer membrane protein [Chryseobacterium paridis]